MGQKQNLEKNHLTTRKQNLACLTCDRARLEPQQWDDEWFRALKIGATQFNLSSNQLT